MTFYPLDHLLVEHNYSGTSWQDLTAGLVSANVVLREFHGTHTCSVSFYNDAVGPATGTDSHVMKRGDKVRVWMDNPDGFSRKAATFLVTNIQTAVDLSKPAGRTHKVTATLTGAGHAGIRGSAQAKGVDTLDDLSDIITGAPFEIGGDGFGSGRTTAIGTSTEVASVDTASELDQLLLTRDSNPGTIMFEDPNGTIQVFDAATARTAAPTLTLGPGNYSKIDVAYDASHVINVLAIKYLQKIKSGNKPTRVVEHNFKYTDAASIVKFGHLKKTITVHHKIDFADYAARVFANNADPAESPRSVTIPIREAAELLPGYEDGTYVGGKVFVVLPDGVTTYTCRIEKITHAITPGRWLVQVFLRNQHVIQRPVPEASSIRTEVANNPDGTVQTAHLDDNAVDTRVLAPESVDGTHLAADIDASGVSFKGGFWSTGDTLPRVVIQQVAGSGRVIFEPDFSPGSGSDGAMFALGEDGFGQLTVQSPQPDGTVAAKLDLTAQAGGPRVDVTGLLSALNNLEVVGASTLHSDLDVLGDLRVGLGSSIAKLKLGQFNGVSGASGQINVTHSLGAIPTLVMVSDDASNHPWRAMHNAAGDTTTQFRVTVRRTDTDASAPAGTPILFDWIALL